MIKTPRLVLLCLLQLASLFPFCQQSQAAPKAVVWVGTDAAIVGGGSDSVSQLSVDLPSALRKALTKKGYQVVLTQDQPHDLEARLQVDTELTYAVLDAWVVFSKATLFMEQEGTEVLKVDFPSDEHGGHWKSYGQAGERYAVQAAQALVDRLDASPAMASYITRRAQAVAAAQPQPAAISALPPQPAAAVSAGRPTAAAPEVAVRAMEEKLPEPRSDAFAIVIGIDYRGRQDVPALQYASQDAAKIFQVLTDPRYGGVPKENAVLLQNEQASKNAILASLRKIKGRDGFVYVYYSGHGAPKTQDSKVVDTMLVPYDVDVSDPEAMEESSVKMSYLKEVVSSSRAKGIMVAIDACFSGGAKSVTPKGGKPLVGMLPSADLFQPKGDGRIIITSSASNEQSWEDGKELQGGIFSHYLLDGLQGKGGKDMWVKVRELSAFLEANVPAAALRLKGVGQTPQTIGAGDFVVTRNWEKTKVADVEIARSRLKVAFERGRISPEQLSRAMKELESGNRSKMLDSFLAGSLEEENFGKLY